MEHSYWQTFSKIELTKQRNTRKNVQRLFDLDQYSILVFQIRLIFKKIHITTCHHEKNKNLQRIFET